MIKINKYFKVSALASLASLLFLVNPLKVQSESSSKPFVVFVNGNGDCCAGDMTEVKALAEKLKAEVWTTSYARFKDKSVTNRDPATGLSTDLDKKFITEAVQKLNSVPESRPVVLIGHSFGGDSILKVLPRINRRIQLVVTIDPVGSGGLRSVATQRKVSSNVDYFLNRWQENGVTGSNIVPFDSRINGSISCDAKVCDQDSQNLARNFDHTPIKVSCGAQEVTCDGWRLPGCNFGGCWDGSNGTKSKRMFHNDMPRDGFIQQIVSEKMQAQLTATKNKWSQTPAIDIQDVTVSSSGIVWVTGKNGTVWFSDDGNNFSDTGASGFSRIATGSNNIVWAVGTNGSLWKFSNNKWSKTPASGMGDVAVTSSGIVWLAGKDGSVWYTEDDGNNFSNTGASGFSRIATGSNNIVWAVGTDGSLWKFSNNEWSKTPASGMRDVAVSSSGRVWLAGKDGTVWFSNDGNTFSQIDASGFNSISVNNNGIVWAVGDNGTLWKYDENRI